MLTGVLNKIREERATRLYDVTYIREMVMEDAIEDRFFYLDDKICEDIDTMFKEAAELVDHIPDDNGFRAEEISRILNATRNISFDEMLGIDEIED